MVVTNQDQYLLALRQLGELSSTFVLEPVGRNTAPAFSAAQELPRAQLALPEATTEVSVAPKLLPDRTWFPAPSNRPDAVRFPSPLSHAASPALDRITCRAAPWVGIVELRI